MNKQTKIGLLAGLTFIILFGVILNNKAPDVPTRPETVLTARPSAPGGAIPLRELPLVPPPANQDPLARASDPSSGPSKTPQQGYGSPVAEPLPTLGQIPLSPSAELPESPGRAETSSEAASAARPALTPAVGISEPPAVAPQPVQSPRAARTTVYVVKPGDNLTKIARTIYGKATRRNIEAIFAANRDKMPSKDRLLVGMKLRIPKPLESPKKPESSTRKRQEPSPRAAENLLKTGKFERAPDLKPARTGQARPKANSSGRTGSPSPESLPRYQIQKGDNWYKLAKRFLGDPNRWQELYQLNRDIFPNPSRLRTGVKIRLPLEASDRLASR